MHGCQQQAPHPSWECRVQLSCHWTVLVQLLHCLLPLCLMLPCQRSCLPGLSAERCMQIASLCSSMAASEGNGILQCQKLPCMLKSQCHMEITFREVAACFGTRHQPMCSSRMIIQGWADLNKKKRTPPARLAVALRSSMDRRASLGPSSCFLYSGEQNS